MRLRLFAGIGEGSGARLVTEVLRASTINCCRAASDNATRHDCKNNDARRRGEGAGVAPAHCSSGEAAPQQRGVAGMNRAADEEPLGDQREPMEGRFPHGALA